MPPEAWSGAGATASATTPHELGADAAAAGAVEVDEVDPACAGRGEARRERDRVARALDDVVVDSAVQPHGVVAEHVDGRDDLDRSGEPRAQLDV